jgi:hypothetical protein
MSADNMNRIDLTNDREEATNNAITNVGALGQVREELEKRAMPLVVIAIIAILIGLLLPA